MVRYKPLGGSHETYEITIAHSPAIVHVDTFGNTDGPGGSYIGIIGRRHGGTNYHERFVYMPHDLHILKTDAATEVTLRKIGDHIAVVVFR